jgi:hypothetical protein
MVLPIIRSDFLIFFDVDIFSFDVDILYQAHLVFRLQLFQGLQLAGSTSASSPCWPAERCPYCYLPR